MLKIVQNSGCGPTELRLLSRRVSSFSTSPSSIREGRSSSWDSRTSRNRSEGNQACRVRQGRYRILYEVRDNVLVVLVITVGSRNGVYR